MTLVIGFWTTSNPLFGPLVSAYPSLRQLEVREDRYSDPSFGTHPHIDHTDFAHLLHLSRLESFTFFDSLGHSLLLDGSCLAVLFKITSLQFLRLLGCNAIIDSDLDVLLSHRPTLQKLYLNDCSIQGPGLERLALLSSLTELHLPCARNVTYAYVQHLFTKLTRLNLLSICDRQLETGISHEQRAKLAQDTRIQFRPCYHERQF